MGTINILGQDYDTPDVSPGDVVDWVKKQYNQATDPMHLGPAARKTIAQHLQPSRGDMATPIAHHVKQAGQQLSYQLKTNTLSPSIWGRPSPEHSTSPTEAALTPADMDAAYKRAGAANMGGGAVTAPAGSTGGGGKNTKSKKDDGVPGGVISFIRSQNPNLSKSAAASLFKQYQASQKYAGLQTYMQQQGKAQDPATVQAFFAQTVAPYLAQAGQAYQGGVTAGDQAMAAAANNNSLPSAERNVLNAYRPIITNSQRNVGNAMQGAAVAGPAFDTLIQQLGQAYNQQLANRFYTQQAAAGGGAASGGDAASQLAALGIKL